MRPKHVALLLQFGAWIALPAIAAPAFNEQPLPRFAVLPNKHLSHIVPGKSGGTGPQLAQWIGKFRDKTGATIQFTMVGTDPARNNAATTIPVVIVPIRMVYGSTNGSMTLDPTTHVVQGTTSTVLQMVLGSPLLKSSLSFQQGGVNLGQGLTNKGQTQYTNAFQRGNFWSSVKSNTAYQVLLGSPTVLATQTIQVADSQGKIRTNPFGVAPVGTMDIRAFDLYLQSYVKSFAAITPGVLPLFITHNIFLTDSAGCCIVGYHSANALPPGGQTYAYSAFIDDPGSFGQDVSGISHELGEWLDDPFVTNLVNCTNDGTNGQLETGDPLERDTNYGAYPYTVGAYTYHLQSLVYMPYWGAPATTSVNNWFTFQGSPAQNPGSHDSIAGTCPGQ